jgi:putative AdoMet-dependent methyltransferase
MLNKQGFNLWADGYDKTVQLSEESDQYPFAGYKSVLNQIFNEVMQTMGSRVLDVGFGTGVLTAKLYEHGHHIDGLDFSPRMIELAQAKMPMAHLIEWDISQGLPEMIKDKKYDSIISTYALHHLPDEEKTSFLRGLLPLLTKSGKIYIGDIGFQKREELEKCREHSRGYWDEDEYYFVYEEFQSAVKSFCTSEFHQISHCGGVMVISR